MSRILLRQLAARLRALTGRDRVYFEGQLLPPREMRFCGSRFKGDEFFLSSARAEALRLVERCGVTTESRILDVGCGPGRLAIGLMEKPGEVAAYHGIDVDPVSVGWCQRHLARDDFRFTHLDLRNARYNPSGGDASSGDSAPENVALRLPFADRSFDVIYLYSVFSHLLLPDIRAYLDEFARLLDHGGTLFLTGFFEASVPDVMENPEGYRQDWKGPLHCVRYDRHFFESLLTERGMGTVESDYATATDGQTALYIRHQTDR